ncbi:hypothetical protein NESM_000538900 [Novymonas esmeraldas]|uniref:AAA+ ATPase domain-containing protein n=1 Tax=Novymonas esmeraldas TaxID=1808958 RepID=A0AAW0EQQ5_9TRYP
MATPAYHKKQQAQQYLAATEVQALTESLVAAVAQSRPRSPMRALLAALDRMEAEAAGGAAPTALLTPRLVLFTGPPGSGKTVQASHTATALRGVHCAVLSLARDAVSGGRLPGSKEVYVPPPLQADVRAAKEALTPPTPSLPQAASASSSLPPELAARLIANRIQHEMRQRQATATAAGAVLFVLDGYPSNIAEALALEAATNCEISLAVSLRCTTDSLQSRRRSAASPARLASLTTLEEFWSAQHKLRVVDGAQSIAAVTRQVLSILQDE